MRTSTNQLSADGLLFNGFDYENQAWVIGGVYKDCGHPQPGAKIEGRTDSFTDSNGVYRTITIQPDVFDGCNCYGRAHAGEACVTTGHADNVIIARR